MPDLLNILRLVAKELRSFRHDKVLPIFILWVFTGGIYTAATGMSQELHKAPIAIVDEDQSTLSKRIDQAFYPPYFNEPVLINFQDIDQLLDKGLYTFILDIPPDFQHDVLAGKKPAIQVNIDATRMSQAFIGAGYIQNIINGEVDEFVSGYRGERELPINLTVRARFNPNLTGFWFGGIMELVSNITMLSIILAGASLIREREHGTLEHLLVMPLRPSEIMLSKVIANGLIILVAAGLSLWLLIENLMAVPIAGSIPLFLAGAALYLFSTTSMGIFLGTVVRSMPQLALLIFLIVIPLDMLSGTNTPRESMPEFIQTIMLATPTTHFVSVAKAILYRGAGFDVVWPSYLAIAFIGLVLFLFSLHRFRRSVSQG